MPYIEDRSPKRQKIVHDSSAKSSITSANQIHQLLEFRQSLDDTVSANLEYFKSYLVSLSQLENGSSERSRHLQILLEYSQWQKAVTDEQLDFHDLLSIWSLATEQSDNDTILILIPDILTLFLQTISGSLDLRQCGIALIDNLLRRDQSKLFGKGLAVAKTKPQLSATCLRLLKEMVVFDGGDRAQAIWLRRDLFINRDALLLNSALKRQDQPQQVESLRPLTINLILTLVKYLDSNTRTEFLTQGKTLHGLLQPIATDTSQDILDILDMIEKCLVDDRDIPRSLLQRFFNSVHLEHLSSLYSYQANNDGDDRQGFVREAVHILLQKLCTTAHGILLPQNDWYPSDKTVSSLQSYESDYIDLGLNALNFNDDFTNSVPVKNTTLSNYIQKLKPFQDVLQSSLLVDILKAAPELVADYFSRKKQIPSPDSDDAAWRGAMALLFSIVELPVRPLKTDMNTIHPPPTTIVIENVVPRPLDRAYFQKLIASSDDILKITGARLLTTILFKLERVLLVITSASDADDTYLWGQAREKLVEMTQARIPPIRDIILALQHTSSIDAGLYTVMLECFATYLKVLPGSSATTHFDISPVMTGLCSRVNDSEVESAVRESIAVQLRHCVQIAELTSATNWLQKSDSDTLSTLGQLIRAVFAEHASEAFQGATQAIERVLLYQGIVTNSHACLALFSSLKVKKKLRHFSPTNELFLFLDNSIVKSSQKPVKYLDEIENAQRVLSDKKPLSLLAASISEQWTFVVKKYEGDKSVIKNLASFTAQLFSNLEKASQNFRVMQYLREQVENNCGEKVKKYIEDAFHKVSKLSTPTSFDKELLERNSTAETLLPTPEQEGKEYIPTLDEFKMPPYQLIPIPESLEGLDKWSSSTDFEVEIRSNQLTRLIFVLSSSEEELRIQALQLLQRVTHFVDISITAFDAKSQVFLLLSELLETIKLVGLNSPLPTIFPQLAHQLLRILVQPGDKMYVKTNKFLLASPTWDVKRLIKYWADRILLRQPGADDPSSNAWRVEVTWLMTLLNAGIRTVQDLELYRRSGIWERVMSLYASPVVGVNIRRMIIVMLWRVCDIPGGADTLWTRFGVYSWLQQMRVIDSQNEALLMAFQADLEKQCDRKAMNDWKLGCALLARDSVAVH